MSERHSFVPTRRRRAGGRSRQRTRYLVVAGANAIIDFGTINYLVHRFQTHSGPGLLACNGAAFFLSTVNSYLLNHYWTFEETGRPRPGQCLLFFFFALSGLGVNTVVVQLFCLLGPPPAASSLLWVNTAKAFASLASTAWNYQFYRYLVFRRWRRYRIEAVPGRYGDSLHIARGRWSFRSVPLKKEHHHGTEDS